MDDNAKQYLYQVSRYNLVLLELMLCFVEDGTPEKQLVISGIKRTKAAIASANPFNLTVKI